MSNIFTSQQHYHGAISRIASWLLLACTALSFGSCTEDPEEPGLNLNPGKPDPKPEVAYGDNFTTGGYVVYHLRTGNFGESDKSIITAAVDGTIMCHDKNGVLKWRNKDYVANFPFDIELADVDSDGLDEVFVAKAGGVLEAYDDNGELMWKNTIASQGNLYQVRAAKSSNGTWRVFTGGTSEELYVYFGNSGELEKTFPMKYAIRSIVRAKFESADYESIVVHDIYTGLSGGGTFCVFNPETLEYRESERVWDTGYRQKAYTLLPIDRDGDGIDELYASGDDGNIRLFEHDDAEVIKRGFCITNKNIPDISYRMTFLHDVIIEGKNVILGQYGGYLIIYDYDGTALEVIKSYNDYSNSFYDPETTTLYLTSSVSGGDGIYRIDLSKSDWRTAFENLKYVGVMSSVEKNLEELAEQVKKFTRPSYQKSPRDLAIIGTNLVHSNYDNISFVESKILTEKFPADKEEQLWCQGVEPVRNYKYDSSQEDILNYARDCEKKKEYFTLRAGHGTDVFMSPETMEKVIEAAPNYFYGFILTEMEKFDSRMQAIISDIFEPLTAKCKAKGKKIIFWNKNIFWCGSCYYDFWEQYLFNPEYSDTIIPALEETNSRTQEMSLAANVGLWGTGYFKSWSCRVVTDNTSFDRMWEWSSQQSPSLYFRQIAINAAYGSDVIFTDVTQGEISTYVKNQLEPLHEILSKGVVIIPESAEESLSISPLCLGMKTPPSNRYLDSGKNGHDFTLDDNLDAAPMVFDRMDTYWGAAPTLDHDFSKYGYGCDRRYLNFLPRLPYGMVPIVPAQANLAQYPPLSDMVETDGEYFYEGATQRDAVSYKTTMLNKLQDAAANMVVKVVGDVSWSAVKVDQTHFRLILADYGYIEPADREVTVMLRNIDPVSAKNILTGEKYTMSEGVFTMTVPAGVFSAIDIEYK